LGRAHTLLWRKQSCSAFWPLPLRCRAGGRHAPTTTGGSWLKRGWRRGAYLLTLNRPRRATDPTTSVVCGSRAACCRAPTIPTALRETAGRPGGKEGRSLVEKGRRRSGGTWKIGGDPAEVEERGGGGGERRRPAREMKRKPLTLEKYHRFFLDPCGTRITIDQLNEVRTVKSPPHPVRRPPISPHSSGFLHAC
jgi:hypothetical protein